MSMHPSRQAMAFKLPEMLSYHSTWDDADYEPVQPRRRSWADRLAVFGRVLSLPRRISVRNEMYAMSDRELADIGISRYDVERVFDPDFAREYAARGR